MNQEVLSHLSQSSLLAGTPRGQVEEVWEEGGLGVDLVTKLQQRCLDHVEAALEGNVGQEAVAAALQVDLHVLSIQVGLYVLYAGGPLCVFLYR